MKTIKHLLVGILAFSLASIALCQTKVPVSLLNPTGSTAGQAIVSTGPSTAPGFSNIPVANVTGAAPLTNALLIGPTTNTTPPAADASNKIPNTNWVTAYFLTPAAGNTLYAPITGSSVYGVKASPLSQFAATTSAQLSGMLSDETGTGSAVFGTTPTITTPNIVGIASGAAAATGSVGEQPTASTSTVPLTTATATNATSKLLTAGQYQVSCTAQFIPAGTTTLSILAVGVSTTSATRPSYANETLFQLPFPTGLAQQIASPVVNLNVSTSTTAYCTAYASFGVSTMTVSGTINALRVR